jgi:iron complex outermembrane recepter protein
MASETVLSRSIRLMFAGGVVVGLGLGAARPALAQEEAAPAPAQPIQRVEITGSSIKRIAAEGALPVTVVNAEAIRQTGATSVVDLVKKLAQGQGATGESGSVGGESFGFSGISIHNVGETRTLVLLNGKRLAQFGGQTLTGFAAGFDLNALPISAIERVELLTDRAPRPCTVPTPSAAWSTLSPSTTLPTAMSPSAIPVRPTARVKSASAPPRASARSSRTATTW